jgi:two-component system, NarL family, response regulator LiaR
MTTHQMRLNLSPDRAAHLKAEENWALEIRLSQREQEVLKLIVEGCSNTEIANVLYLSPNTIKCHVRSILNKFGVDHRIQAAVLASRHNLI